MDYFFIVAAPRSGTTFLSSTMDHAPFTRSVIGDLMLPVTCSLHRLSLLRKDKDYSDAIEHGFESEIVRRSEIHSRFETLHRFATGRQGLANTTRLLTRKRRYERFVFKEPFISFSPTLATNRIASGVFWLVRDGRDVANSLVNTYNVLSDEDLRTCRSNENPVKTRRLKGDLYVPWWLADEHVDAFLRSSQYVRAGLMWAFCIESCLAAYDGHPQVHRERYEDLVADPDYCEAVIRKFLDAPKAPRLSQACRSASKKSVGSYRRRGSSENSALEALIGDHLARFGYS